MISVKSLWRHVNGRVYAVQSDTIGHITGAAGPLDARGLPNPDDCDYEPGITGWITRAIARQELSRVNPKN